MQIIEIISRLVFFPKSFVKIVFKNLVSGRNKKRHVKSHSAKQCESDAVLDGKHFLVDGDHKKLWIFFCKVKLLDQPDSFLLEIERYG